MIKAMKILPIILLFASCDNAHIDEAETLIQPLSIFRNCMLGEINLVRTNPFLYAELRLKSEAEANTDNGSYKYLKSLRPVDSLSFNNQLNKSALEYATLLKDSLSHCFEGTPMSRARLAGYTGTIIGENISGAAPIRFNALQDAGKAAIEFVRILIIDEGVADLGHRYVILDPKYKTVGIGYKRNKTGKYINYLVQLFGN